MEKAFKYIWTNSCSGDTLLITAKVTLDPNTAGPETVFEGQDILLKNSMYAGLFDEKTNDITLHFPAVELKQRRTNDYLSLGR